MYSASNEVKTLAVSPSLPFLHQLPEGLKTGYIFTITGKVKYDAERIEVNFNCGRGADPDVAVHFNPRFDDNFIVLNHYKNRQWGKEDRLPMCFRRGEDFQLIIEVEFNKFKFMVNGGHCGTFRNQFPLPRINILEVVKGIHVMEITLRSKLGAGIPSSIGPSSGAYSANPAPAYRPPSQPSYHPPPPGGYDPPPPSRGPYPPSQPTYHPPPPQPVSYPPQPGGFRPQVAVCPPAAPSSYISPRVPFKHMFNGGIHQGKMIYITGRPKHLPYRFHINFKCSKTRMSNIAFHFDVRFNPDNHVVRNSLIDGSWGQEEIHSMMFPFIPGQTFDMIIKVESARFMVAVNGAHFIEYNHRVLPIQTIDCLDIDGDVSLLSVRVP